MIKAPRLPVALMSVLESHTTIHDRQDSIVLMKQLLFYSISARFSDSQRRRLSKEETK